MNRLQQILVGLDFSPSCRTALAQAARLARLNGAALEAVHVVDLRSVRDYAEVTDQPLMLAEKEVTERMEKELAKWCAAVDLPDGVSPMPVIGIPLDVLLRRSRELNASLLVLGIRGRSSPEGVAGTLALKCLRKTGCKVMLVQEGHTGPFTNAVACVDFSESSREVVEQARRVAAQDGSRIHFIHVHNGLWRDLGK
jgi:nucleotide-binding universal stress UspA family protein